MKSRTDYFVCYECKIITSPITKRLGTIKDILSKNPEVVTGDEAGEPKKPLTMPCPKCFVEMKEVNKETFERLIKEWNLHYIGRDNSVSAHLEAKIKKRGKNE